VGLLVIRNDPPLSLLDTGMVGHGVHPAVTGSEETAQYPADDTDHDPCNKGRPESPDMKSRDDFRDKNEKQCIDDQNEQTHRDDNERKTQEQKDWPHQGINDPKHESGTDQGSRRVVGNTRDDPSSPHDRQGRHEPTDQEFSHRLKLQRKRSVGKKKRSIGKKIGIEIAFLGTAMATKKPKELKKPATSATPTKKKATGTRKTKATSKLPSKIISKLSIEGTAKKPDPILAHDQISLRAYFIAELRQKMGWPGDPATDWEDAISQLKAEALEKPLKKR